MPHPHIQVSSLRKSYGSRPVLKNVSFDVQPGTIFALLGENGAGKTTTVHILSTLLSGDGGNANVGGFDLSSEPDEIRRIISVTGQSATIDEQLTGEENLTLMGRLQHLSAGKAKTRARELLRMFDLEDSASRLAKTYSGGMRRRLDVAISLVARPSVLFLDEPTTGLDPRSRMMMWDMIKELKNDGMTVFLTTQYLEEADQAADAIAVLHNGVIAANGSPGELKALIADERLDFTFASEVDAILAFRLLPHSSIQPCGLTVSIPADHAASDMRAVLNLLHANGCAPSDLRIRKPTLDDVFLQLTAKGEDCA